MIITLKNNLWSFKHERSKPWYLISFQLNFLETSHYLLIIQFYIVNIFCQYIGQYKTHYTVLYCPNRQRPVGKNTQFQLCCM